MIERVYAARVAGDRLVAGASERVPGGVRLRSADLPGVRDYNGVLLEPGAAITAPGDVSRVIAFAPPGPAPAGWSCVALAAMAFEDALPEVPDGPVEVGAGALRDARAALWRSYHVEGPALEEMLEMQARQAAAGRVFATFDGDRPLGWAQVIAETIDDLYVEPGARRGGVGRAVTLACMAAGGRYLTVEPDNAAAVALYRSLGFRDVGTVLHLTRG